MRDKFVIVENLLLIGKSIDRKFSRGANLHTLQRNANKMKHGERRCLENMLKRVLNCSAGGNFRKANNPFDS